MRHEQLPKFSGLAIWLSGCPVLDSTRRCTARRAIRKLGRVSVHFREDQSLLTPYVYQQLRHHRKRRFVGGAPRERYSQSVVSAHNLAQALLNVVGFKPLLDRMDRNTKLMMLKE